MKTAVKQILDNRDKNFDANKFIKWLDENRHNLLHLEEQQITESFNQGYRNGELETLVASSEDISKFDDAINYYHETYDTTRIFRK